MEQHHELVEGLRTRAKSGERAVLRSPELKSLYDELKILPKDERAAFGKAVNALRHELESLLASSKEVDEKREQIDVTAPWADNTPPSDRPRVLRATEGSVHPLMSELEAVLDIYARMGFSVVESTQIDDDYHMFGSLNFPPGHPARDDYDSFMTKEGFIAPAHTSTMQHRVLKAHTHLLDEGNPIAFVIPGRVFRNEDLDARHEHTFHQLEGVYVAKGTHAGMLIATLKTFLQEYYKQEIDVMTQPFYFPFTEPSFEFALSCPFCQKKGCHICSQTGWIELLGCGMIHPNVLKEAGIDPRTYTGFAWGGGLERLVMMKHGIEDIRHFHSARLDFLKQFGVVR
jgi:phenylalanyl-tRNA synthetase alpha chain